MDVAQAAPLWKPEPSLLLTLDLRPEQRTKIERYDADWRSYRDSVQREVGGIQSQVRTSPKSVPQLNSNLQGYAELSREFDRTREAIWQQAVKTLDKDQTARVAEWQKEGVK